MELTMTMSQKLVMSQNMIQSTEILQMSVHELETYIEKLSMENPMIELPEYSSEEPISKQADLQRKLDWLSSTNLQNKIYYQSDSSTENMENNWRDQLQSEETLADYLLSQIITQDFDETEYAMIKYMILSLDEKGYFNEDLEETARILKVSLEAVISMLHIIQSLDPAGIGATNLKECLLLQLERKKDHSKLAKLIVSEHLEEIAKNHLHGIAKKLHVSMDELNSACEEIRRLNPKPGSTFSSREQLRYVSPDAVVVKLEDTFEILVNEYQYPRFNINAYYQDMLKTSSDKEVQKYLQEKLTQANWLSTCITQRTSTLSKVMRALVEFQEEFFIYGPGHKKPMRLSDLAFEVGLHESTISRTLRSKYLQCTWGVFPLNYFLTSVATAATNSNEEKTPEQVKSYIREIIDTENKESPFSDEAISKQLEKYHIKISRRTVNKYRSQMGIPDKGGRKKW